MKLPDPETPVLALIDDRHWIIAAHIPRHYKEATEYADYESDDADYDSATDAEYGPEGWYEQLTSHDVEWWRLAPGRAVTRWQGLPPKTGVGGAEVGKGEGGP